MIGRPELEALCAIAQAASVEVMAVYAGRIASWSKDDRSPLTEADLRANDVICTALARAFPGVPIVSEESPLPPGTPEVFFLVDPLDGTKEFLKRNDEFTVNIALVERGEPVAGVVQAPALGELFFGARGQGACKRDAVGERPIRTAVPVAGAPLRVMGSRSHGADALALWLDQLGAHDFVAAGSSLKFCHIAEGRADVYPRHGPTSQWDTAAAQAVLECAGGAVLDAAARPLRYGLDRDILNPHFIALCRADLRVPALS